jgi:hypothetical protein
MKDREICRPLLLKGCVIGYLEQNAADLLRVLEMCPQFTPVFDGEMKVVAIELGQPKQEESNADQNSNEEV